MSGLSQFVSASILGGFLSEEIGNPFLAQLLKLYFSVVARAGVNYNYNYIIVIVFELSIV